MEFLILMVWEVLRSLYFAINIFNTSILAKTVASLGLLRNLVQCSSWSYYNHNDMSCMIKMWERQNPLVENILVRGVIERVISWLTRLLKSHQWCCVVWSGFVWICKIVKEAVANAQSSLLQDIRDVGDLISTQPYPQLLGAVLIGSLNYAGHWAILSFVFWRVSRALRAPNYFPGCV